MKANLNLSGSSLLFNFHLTLPHERFWHLTKKYISPSTIRTSFSYISLQELKFWDSGQVAKSLCMICKSLRYPNYHPKQSELPCCQAIRNMIKSWHNPDPSRWGKPAILKVPQWLPFAESMYFKQDPLNLCPLSPNYNTQRGSNNKAISEQSKWNWITFPLIAEIIIIHF